ncbi:MAG TPA: UDP-2,3-diacylglucosamine diphosphatase, partial [Chitinophagaceae bacterium]|nr:UDP-2,3-diacylglucosamine diphosphatase [Chitinophagaceae bacterium]
IIRSVKLLSDKKIYFLSDFHLGAPNHAASLEREKIIIQFLDEIKHNAAEIFIVGDMFDFWYEYRQVVPKGYVRLLGKLAELTDAGIPMHFFVGNHDMWMKDYFQKELNIPVYYQPKEFERNGRKFLIAHGDGLGPGDHGYKRLKKIFRNPACKWLFGILPPVMGMGLANYLSRRSRAQTGASEETFLGEEREWLITYCKDVLKQKNIDFFIFGHRHLPIDYRLSPLSTQGTGAGGEVSRYINLGDWIRYYTYAVFDGTDLELKSFKGNENKIIRN